MSKPLISASVAAPGFYGLNSQQSSVTLEDGFALEATNCVIDKYGRLGARKGWRYLTQYVNDRVTVTSVTSSSTTATVTLVAHGRTTGDQVTISGANQTEYNGDYTITVVDADTFTYTFAGSATTPATGTIKYQLINTGQDLNLQGMHRFVDIAGDETIISWSATDVDTGATATFYTGKEILIQPSVTTSNTLDSGNWHSATLNDKAYFFQEGYYPLVYDATTGAITDVEDSYANYIDPATGSAFASESAYRTSIPKANVVLSAYGRLWCARTDTDKMTVYWSDLLDGENWIGGSAGSIDLSAIMVQGTDEIVALGAQNGRLIVFTRRSTVIFGDSTGASTLDPATLVLVEVINRVGCVARDSVQNTGTDIIFLSEDGLRSLGRVIQEKSLPMRDLSANVRDELVRAVSTENVNNIKSVYSEDNAFYLLLLPRYSRVYCFDTRAPLPTGALRVTIWNTQVQTNMLSLPNDVLISHSSGVGQYFGYQDNGSTYPMLYLTNYFDLGSPTQTKILKKLTLTVIGLSDQNFVLKTAFDYVDSYRSYVGNLTALPGSEYNDAEYGLDDTATAVSQSSSTVTDPSNTHYTIADFQTTENEVYEVPYTVWLDSDTYYYTNDDGTRTKTTLYTPQTSYSYEYSVGTVSEPIRLSAGGSGSVLQVGFETTVNGSEFSIQKMDVYAKQGRVF